MNGQPVERDERIALGQKGHKHGSEGKHEEQASNQTGHDGEKLRDRCLSRRSGLTARHRRFRAAFVQLRAAVDSGVAGCAN